MPWSTGSRRPASASPAAAAKASAGRARRCSARGRSRPREARGRSVRCAGPSSSQARQAPARASRKVSSGAPPIATQRAVGAPAVAHRQPAPGKGVRPPVPHCLGGYPPARHRHRPGPQPQQQALAHSEHGETHHLGDREGRPDIPGDIDKPGNQRNEKCGAEREPDDQACPQAPAPQRHGEQRRPADSQRPGAHRREGGGQGKAARQRHRQCPAQRHATACQALAAGRLPAPPQPPGPWRSRPGRRLCRPPGHLRRSAAQFFLHAVSELLSVIRA